ncbi:hypothetical protein [Streptomyces sp. NPDC058657]|uniref:hypothetical protein n=1 Tax=unclassified Streptomyces TaxID=2593676 RepID=UPI003654C6B9
MARARITPNRRGIAALLKSAGVREVIARKTQDVARAATAAAEPDHGQFRTDISTEGNRVRGAVIGDYATSDPEDSRRALLRGLDGGSS